MRRKWLLVSAAIAAGGVVAARGAPFIGAWYASERAAAQELAWNVANARRAIAASRAVDDSVARLARVLRGGEPTLFRASTISAAASAAGAYVSAVAREARVELSALQVGNDTSTAGLRRINITASARGDITGLTRLLARLEAGPRLVQVASLSVSQPDIMGHPDSPEALTIQLALRVLARTEPRR